MTTTKKKKEEKSKLDDNQIIALYMEAVLESKEPLTVYSFCKNNKIEEAEFYVFFNSINALRQEIWIKFFENVKTIIEKEPAYLSYTSKDKLLTLYFTFFEILNLNRSYVVFSLEENKEGLKNLIQLKALRMHFKDFINTIIESEKSESNSKINKIKQPIFAEAAWLQLLFVLKFWLNDTSKGFEKTDILIEKTITTATELVDTKPLDSLLDLGKFIWKEVKLR
jgi:hypothetical protein